MCPKPPLQLPERETATNHPSDARKMTRQEKLVLLGLLLALLLGTVVRSWRRGGGAHGDSLSPDLKSAPVSP